MSSEQGLIEFGKIRFFIDHFISIQHECNPIFRKYLNFEKEKVNIFSTLDRDENSEIYDLLGRNVFHYAICYGDHKEGILWCLIQNEHLLDKTDVFGCNFMSYFVLLTNVNFPASKTRKLSYYFPYFDWVLSISGKMQDLIYTLIREPRNVSATTKPITGNEKDLLFSENQIAKLIKMIRSIPVRRYVKDSEHEYFNLDDELLDVLDEQEIDETQIRSYIDLFPDLNNEDKREASFFNINGKVRIFSDAILKRWQRPETYLNTIAMASKSEGYFRVAISMFEIVPINNKNIRPEMLSLMTRNGCALFKNCVEHDRGFDFEVYLWEYCKEQHKLQEMYDFVKTTELCTFRRMCSSSSFHSKYRGPELIKRYYYEFYDELKDENLRNEMMLIVRNRLDEMCDKDFIHSVNIFSWMWKFLKLEDKENVLEKRFAAVRLYITNLSLSPYNASRIVNVICKCVSPEVGRKYQDLLEKVQENNS